MLIYIQARYSTTNISYYKKMYINNKSKAMYIRVYILIYIK